MTMASRIAVMDRGVVRQIGTATDVYEYPNSRFVAGFIGRTNLVTAQVNNGLLTLAGLSGTLRPDQAVTGGASDVRVSIRPQSLYLGNEGSAREGAVAMGEVSVLSRTYLGEHWDYVVSPVGGGDSLRVHAPPASVLEVGQQSPLFIDPRGVAVVS